MEGTKGQKATVRFNTPQCGVSLEQHGAELDSTVLQPISSGKVCLQTFAYRQTLDSTLLGVLQGALSNPLTSG